MFNKAFLWTGLFLLACLPVRLSADVVIVHAEWNVTGRPFNADSIDVSLNGPGYSGIGITDESGLYTFQSVPNEFTGTLSATDPRGISVFNSVNVNVSEGHLGKLDVYITSDQLTIGVSGQVTENDTPVQNVSIEAWTSSGRNYGDETDANGQYHVICPPYVTIVVTPANDGYYYQPQKYQFDNLITLQTGSHFSRSILNISGHVTTPDGVGIGGVTISATGQPDSGTDSDGYYQMNIPPHFTGTVTAQKTGYGFEPERYIFNDVTDNQTNKDFTAYSHITIAGTVSSISLPEEGIKNAKISFSNEGAVYTDGQGNYSKQVPVGWSGTLTIHKKNYIFRPEKHTLGPVNSNISDADFTGYKLYQLSGWVTIYNAGIENIDIFIEASQPEMNGFSTMTDQDGYYSVEVPETADGTIYAKAEGLEMTPAMIEFSSLSCNLTEQNFKAMTNKPAIAGKVKINNAGLGRVKLVFTDEAGIVKECTSNRDGFYCMILKQASPVLGWTGTVVPFLDHFDFTPAQRAYKNIKDHVIHQDYDAVSDFPTISGRTSVQDIGIKNVRVETEPADPGALPVLAFSDSEGYYNICLSENGWSGRVWAQFEDNYGNQYKWKPEFYDLQNITISQFNKDFVGATTGFYISGTVREKVFSKNDASSFDIHFSDNISVHTDNHGNYFRSVPIGWFGTAVPKKQGYQFNPNMRMYEAMGEPKINQDYTAIPVSPTISGRIHNTKGIGIGRISVIFAPENGQACTVLTDATGCYSGAVVYGWTGMVRPLHENYYFTPQIRSYGKVIGHQADQDFIAVTEKEMNVFTGIGNWTDDACWSKRRMPKDHEIVLIAGECNMNTSMPLLSMLIINKPQKTRLTIVPKLDMNKILIPDIPTILNNGVLCTSYTDGMPFPPNRCIGGEIVFDFEFQDPPEIGPRQIIPPGIYNKLTLTGNKIAYVHSGTAYAQDLFITNGAQFGDPSGTGGIFEFRIFPGQAP